MHYSCSSCHLLRSLISVERGSSQQRNTQQDYVLRTLFVIPNRLKHKSIAGICRLPLTHRSCSVNLPTTGVRLRKISVVPLCYEPLHTSEARQTEMILALYP